MDDDIVIKVEHVSKKYCKSLKRGMLYGVSDIVRNSLGMGTHSDRLRKHEFWALDDVSFEVKKGETLGIIGPNGSGKTTLLKMLNGIFWPDKGKITIKGKVGALIAVGAGFHPLLTGRENIYVNAAILGMTKKEVVAKLDDIIEFADIGDFLDTPVKFYSSGMYVRLGFAVAVHCEPSILLVDEVLAVGDKDFQIKCWQKIYQIKKRGTTIVLVTHNENTIREGADKCIYINKGKVKLFGSPEESTNLYMKEVMEHREVMNLEEKIERTELSTKGNIVSINIYDKKWNEIFFIETGQEINIVVECLIKKAINKPIIGVIMYNNRGFLYVVINQEKGLVPETLNVGRIKIKINISSFHIPADNYGGFVSLSEGNQLNYIDYKLFNRNYIVGRSKNSLGSVELPTKWEVEKI